MTQLKRTRPADDRWLPVAEVRDRAGVTDITVREWRRRGLLAATRLPTGRYRYSERSLRALLEGRQP